MPPVSCSSIGCCSQQRVTRPTYGFIPETLAEDGDPLDALALVTEPTFPGCRIRVRPVGAFLIEDQGRSDHKVLCVPDGDPLWATAR